jgi:hypothetical protein
MALVSAGIAGASVGKPRFYSKYPRLQISRYEVTVDHTAGYTQADCVLSSGNRRSGWRHIVCHGKVHESGGMHPFKLVTTPASCSRLEEVFTVPGVGSTKTTVVWPHYFFSCRR